LRIEVNHVCAKAFGGYFEANSGSGRVFIEEVHNGFAAERWQILDGSLIDLSELLSAVEQSDCRVLREVSYRGQVFHIEITT
jgi:hypothetical protein